MTQGSRSGGSKGRSKKYQNLSTASAKATSKSKLVAPSAPSLAGYFIIVATVCLSYYPLHNAGFVWDDVIITKDLTHVGNPSPFDGLYNIWMHLGRQSYRAVQHKEIHYWPMTYTSFWAEFWIHGLNPKCCHFSNVALHAANACLLNRIVGVNLGLGARVAMLSSILFANHPMNVESVAWVIERKDTLSGMFYLLALLYHPNVIADFTTKRNNPPSPTRKSYPSSLFLSLVFYVLAMLSKTSVATLPSVLLLIPWAMRGRISVSEMVQSFPFFAVGLPMAIYDMRLARAREPVDFGHSLVEKVLLSSRVSCFCLSKLVWPADQPIIYPRWNVKDDAGICLTCFALISSLLLVFFFARNRTGRLPIASLLFFGGSLVPVLGLIDFGFMDFSFVADRFMYLAGLGPVIFLSVVWEKIAGKRRLPLFVVLLGILIIRTQKQASVYVSPESFWSHIVERNPTARGAHYNLGNEWLRQKEWTKAEAAYKIALSQTSVDANVFTNYAVALQELGRPEESIAQLEKAIEIDPMHVTAFNGLGKAKSSLGRHEEAFEHHKRAIELDPGYIVGNNNAGYELATLKRYEESLPFFRAAIRSKPNYTNARKNLAYILEVLGRNEEAIKEYRQILVYNPSYQLAKERLDKLINYTSK